MLVAKSRVNIGECIPDVNPMRMNIDHLFVFERKKVAFELVGDTGAAQNMIIVCYRPRSEHMRPTPLKTSVLRAVGAPGQDIFRGDVSCQTHFFRGVGGVAKLHLVGALLVGGGGGQVCPALNQALS